MSNNYNSTLQSNNTDLQTVLQTLQTKAAGGEQATPVISVSSNGLITATAGTKSATKQLAFQAAKTITPTTTSQIAVSSGYYTGGNITVAGDSNLVAGNIKSGVSIFGVNGNYEGGDTSAEDGLVTRTITSYTNDRITAIGSYAFWSYKSLTSINFPACTSIGNSAFAWCTNLTSINFPVCTTIGGNAFYSCNNIASSVSFPTAKTIGSYAFYSCKNIVSINFPVCTTISSHAFHGCSQLSKIYLTASSVCALSNSNAFSQTYIWSNKGSIFVPSSLIASYKTATNWAFFSNRIYSA